MALVRRKEKDSAIAHRACSHISIQTAMKLGTANNAKIWQMSVALFTSPCLRQGIPVFHRDSKSALFWHMWHIQSQTVADCKQLKVWSCFEILFKASASTPPPWSWRQITVSPVSVLCSWVGLSWRLLLRGQMQMPCHLQKRCETSQRRNIETSSKRQMRTKKKMKHSIYSAIYI